MRFPWRHPGAGLGRARRADVAGTIARALADAGLATGDGTPRRAGGNPARLRTRPREVPLEPGTTRHDFTHEGHSRRYLLFVPDAPPTSPRGLVMMLHGCTQDAADFAAGTRMSAHAATRGWIVVYPEQDARANGARCWNWFQPGDQHGDRGEPALLAALARTVAAAHGVARERIHVAGLSAGGAMAAILAREHPTLFASWGVHSGLPAGAAHDVPSAFAAMKRAPSVPAASLAPVIVFHGDADSTVDRGNGDAIVAAQRSATTQRESGRVVRDYERIVHRADDGRVVAEHWVIRGAGHAWSGGSERGSWTDPSGPDASAEMLRFFAEQPGRG